MPYDVPAERLDQVLEAREWFDIKNKAGVAKFMELGGKVLPTICISRDLVFQSIIPQYEELIDEMAKRAPTETMSRQITALRGKGFDFDKVEENLDRAGSGQFTRSNSKE